MGSMDVPPPPPMTLPYIPLTADGKVDTQGKSGDQLAGEASAAILVLQTDVNNDLQSPPPQTSAALGQQSVKNAIYQGDITNIETLISKATAAGVDTAGLQSQLAALQQNFGTLKSATESSVNNFLQANIPPTPPNSKTPVLSLPLSEQKVLLTPKDQANLFLLPSLTTALFVIMQQVQKQKLENMNEYRILEVSMISQVWKEAENVADMTFLSGQAKANSLLTQAITSLITGCFQIGLGVGAMAQTVKVSAKSAQEIQSINKERTEDPDPANRKPEMDSLEKANLRSKNLQEDKSLQILQMFEKSAPNILNAIGSFNQYGYQMDEARYEAAKVTYQAMESAMQTLLQQITKAFDDQGSQIDSINSFLQQYSQAVTRMMRG